VRDFGQVVAGETVPGVFLLQNVTAGPVTITRVSAACGCTTVDHDLTGTTLPPRQLVTLGISLKSRGLGGRIRKSVEVAFRDAAAREGSLSLTMTGMVLPRYAATPAKLNLGTIAPDETAEHIIEITSANPQSFRVRQAVSNDKMLYVEPVTDSGDRSRIALRTVPPLRPGRHDLKISVTIDDRENSLIVIPVSLIVEPGRPAPPGLLSPSAGMR